MLHVTRTDHDVERLVGEFHMVSIHDAIHRIALHNVDAGIRRKSFCRNGMLISYRNAIGAFSKPVPRCTAAITRADLQDSTSDRGVLVNHLANKLLGSVVHLLVILPRPW